MTTEEIINELRAHQMSAMRSAADRLEELSKLLKSAKLDNDRYQRDLMQYKCPENPYRPDWVKKDPSRLEIAAMLKAGWFANPDALTRRDEDPKWWIERADELIKAAKEAK